MPLDAPHLPREHTRENFGYSLANPLVNQPNRTFDTLRAINHVRGEFDQKFPSVLPESARGRKHTHPSRSRNPRGGRTMLARKYWPRNTGPKYWPEILARNTGPKYWPTNTEPSSRRRPGPSQTSARAMSNARTSLCFAALWKRCRLSMMFGLAGSRPSPG
jgi:hypothetical protein